MEEIAQKCFVKIYSPPWHLNNIRPTCRQTYSLYIYSTTFLNETCNACKIIICDRFHNWMLGTFSNPLI